MENINSKFRDTSQNSPTPLISLDHAASFRTLLYFVWCCGSSYLHKPSFEFIQSSLNRDAKRAVLMWLYLFYTQCDTFVAYDIDSLTITAFDNRRGYWIMRNLMWVACAKVIGSDDEHGKPRRTIRMTRIPRVAAPRATQSIYRRLLRLSFGVVRCLRIDTV